MFKMKAGLRMRVDLAQKVELTGFEGIKLVNLKDKCKIIPQYF